MVERALHLPSGSARARKLFLLGVRAETVPDTELRRGDHLVVEPGAHFGVGRLVACHARGAIVLRVARRNTRGEVVLTAPGPQLTLSLEAEACAAIGTVVAALRFRPDGRVASAWPPSYSFSFRATGARRSELEEQIRKRNTAALDLAFDALEAETRATRLKARAQRIDAAMTRLRALRRCLDVVKDDRLYRALATEINSNLARLRRDLVGTARWAPLALALRPLSCDVTGFAREDGPLGTNAQRQ